MLLPTQRFQTRQEFPRAGLRRDKYLRDFYLADEIRLGDEFRGQLPDRVLTNTHYQPIMPRLRKPRRVCKLEPGSADGKRFVGQTNRLLRDLRSPQGRKQ